MFQYRNDPFPSDNPFFCPGLRSLLELEVILEAVDGNVHHRRLVLDERRHGEFLRLVPRIHVPEISDNYFMSRFTIFFDW